MAAPMTGQGYAAAVKARGGRYDAASRCLVGRAAELAVEWR